MGSGFGGVWTAKDDFVAQRRRTKWYRSDADKPRVLPPRLYVDNKTIIREVPDVCELRHGDHCLIAINLVRSLNPRVDYFFSCLGSIELCYFYHHFIMVDDVDHVDGQGIPRTQSGGLAEMVEYANTIPEAWQEVRALSLGSWLRMPGAVVRFLLNKSKCHRMALADYGDTPHVYLVVENLTAEDRARIVSDALGLLENHPPYHFIFNNCEHVTNLVSRGRFTSPNLHFLLWNAFRTLLCCVGLVFLRILADTCFSKLCVSFPIWAMAAYHVFTTLPVLLQSGISYAMAVASIRRQHAQELIDSDDFWHLLWKELGRCVVVGGGAAAAISLVPVVMGHTPMCATVYGAIACAYVVWDLMYNCLAHAVMRLVLLPVWGKVWLIGSGGDGPVALKLCPEKKVD